MKKLFVTMMLISVVIFTSCSGDDSATDQADCDSLLQAGENAIEAFNNNPTVETCNALKQAAQAFINANCGTAEDQAEVQEILNQLGDCQPTDG